MAARSERISASEEVLVEALLLLRPLLRPLPPPSPPPSPPSFFGCFCFFVEEFCAAVGASAELLSFLKGKEDREEEVEFFFEF